MTRYLVIRKPSEVAESNQASGGYPAGGWKEAGEFTAASSDAAISEAAEKHGNGRYAAIPTRSFKPREVKVEQTTKVKLS